MKIFISSDMEGTCGITHWDETDMDRGGGEYAYMREQMTLEVAAVCKGALEAGIKDILVKDAHDSARNIHPHLLPKEVKIHRGWSDIFCMMSGVKGAEAILFTGYHAAAHCGGNPLSHTMNTSIYEMFINGERASEFTISSYIAALLGIPVIFISGDAEVCEQAKKMIPAISTLVTNKGVGDSVTSLHPQLAIEELQKASKEALEKNISDCLVALPAHFDVLITYKNHSKAFQNSFYPGAIQENETTLSFSSSDYMDVLRFFHFVL